MIGVLSTEGCTNENLSEGQKVKQFINDIPSMRLVKDLLRN